MAETKRTEFEAERDREEIARMYLRGMIQQEITDQINAKYYQDNPLSRQQISYDIRLLVDRWVRASINHIDQKKAIELAKIDRLEIEYWDAWERSKRDAETTTSEREHITVKLPGQSGEQELPGAKNKARMTREGQVGNPAFLEGVMKCINKRCELLGLDAPRKIAPTNPDGNEVYKLVIQVAGNEGNEP